MDNEIRKYCENCKFYSVLGCKSTLICKDGNRFLNFMCNLTDEEAEIYNNRLEAEAADVKPVKRGRWIEHHDLIECNVCGFEVKDTYCEKRDMTSSETSYDYCPKCGADMRSPEATKG